MNTAVTHPNFVLGPGFVPGAVRFVSTKPTAQRLTRGVASRANLLWKKHDTCQLHLLYRRTLSALYTTFQTHLAAPLLLDYALYSHAYDEMGHFGITLSHGEAVQDDRDRAFIMERLRLQPPSYTVPAYPNARTRDFSAQLLAWQKGKDFLLAKRIEFEECMAGWKLRQPLILGNPLALRTAITGWLDVVEPNHRNDFELLLPPTMKAAQVDKITALMRRIIEEEFAD